MGSDVVARRHVAIADRLEQRGREPWNISTRVNMKRARPRNVSRTLYNNSGRGLPSRAAPDTPPLAAVMLQMYRDLWVYVYMNAFGSIRGGICTRQHGDGCR